MKSTKRIQRPQHSAYETMPLERIIHLAEFRAGLRLFLRHNEQVCRRFGLTPQRYLLLLAIKGAPDGSQRLSFSSVAERLQLSRNTVTELCARAEEAGLLFREPSGTDLRVTYLRVTQEGERRLLGVLHDGDDDRGALRDAFAHLAETFRVATRRPRRRSASKTVRRTP